MIGAELQIRMMHPYRDAPAPSPPHDTSDDRVVAAVLAVIGAVPVAVALIAGGRFGAEATVGLLMFVLGVIGLLRAGRRNSERPPGT